MKTMTGQYLSNMVSIKRLRENFPVNISAKNFMVNEPHKPGLRTMVKCYQMLMIIFDG
jgi:hypothetical protein